MSTQTEVTQQSSFASLNGVLVAGLVAMLLVAHRAVLRIEPFNDVDQVVEGVQFYEPASTSPLLVVLISLWMLWRRRERMLLAISRTPRLGPAEWALAIALWSAAAGGLLWSGRVGAPDLGLPALALAMLAAGATLGGVRLLRLMPLPTFVLLAAMPPPAIVLNAIIFELQLFTTHFSAWLLERLGYAVAISLERIFAQGYVFQVIESCAGLRAIETLLLASLVLGEALDAHPIRRVAIFVAAAPVAFFLNAGRVLSIILVSRDASHLVQGLVATCLGVLILAGLDAVMARRWPSSREPTRVTSLSMPRSRALAAAIFSLVLATTSVLASPSETAQGPRPRLALPTRYGPWQATGSRVDLEFLGSAEPTVFTSLELIQGEERARLFVGLDDRVSRSRSGWSEKTLYLESGAQPLYRGLQTDPKRGRVDVLLYRSPSDNHHYLAHRWHVGFGSLAIEAGRSWLGIDRLHLTEPSRAYVVRVARRLSPGIPTQAQLDGATHDLDRIGRQLHDAILTLDP